MIFADADCKLVRPQEPARAVHRADEITQAFESARGAAAEIVVGIFRRGSPLDPRVAEKSIDFFRVAFAGAPCFQPQAHGFACRSQKLSDRGSRIPAVQKPVDRRELRGRPALEIRGAENFPKRNVEERVQSPLSGRELPLAGGAVDGGALFIDRFADIGQPLGRGVGVAEYPFELFDEGVHRGVESRGVVEGDGLGGVRGQKFDHLVPASEPLVALPREIFLIGGLVFGREPGEFAQECPHRAGFEPENFARDNGVERVFGKFFDDRLAADDPLAQRVERRVHGVAPFPYRGQGGRHAVGFGALAQDPVELGAAHGDAVVEFRERFPFGDDDARSRLELPHEFVHAAVPLAVVQLPAARASAGKKGGDVNLAVGAADEIRGLCQKGFHPFGELGGGHSRRRVRDQGTDLVHGVVALFLQSGRAGLNRAAARGDADAADTGRKVRKNELAGLERIVQGGDRDARVGQIGFRLAVQLFPRSEAAAKIREDPLTFVDETLRVRSVSGGGAEGVEQSAGAFVKSGEVFGTASGVAREHGRRGGSMDREVGKRFFLGLEAGVHFGDPALRDAHVDHDPLRNLFARQSR